MSQPREPQWLVVFGPPGTGKTTRLMDLIGVYLEAGVDPNRIGFISFTRAAAQEGVHRAAVRFGLGREDFKHARTIHSLCYMGLGLQRSEVMRPGAWIEFCKAVGLRYADPWQDPGSALDEPWETQGAEEGDILRAFYDWYRNAGRPLEEAFPLWDPGNLEGWSLERAQWFAAEFEHFKQEKKLLDFTDMLLEVLRLEWRPWGVDHWILDEAQDLSPLQQRVFLLWTRRAHHVTVAGDDDQCQPGGTWVLTSTGYKRMDELDPETDRLVSYDRLESAVVGKRTGFRFQRAVRPYRGPLVRVRAGGRQTLCTPDHRWLVRWTDRATDYNVVYLMRRGDWFRLGWCQLFNSEGTLHLGTRARLEDADGTWILKVTPSKAEASIWEKVLAAEYGIPTNTFTARYTEAGGYFTAENIERIFSLLDLRVLFHKAKRCLDQFGLDMDRPFWSKQRAFEKQGGSSLMEVEACNLIPGLMAIPVYEGRKTPSWHSVEVERTADVDIPVYSLNVEKHHKYIADGLITCNCIYSWQGSNSDWLLKLPGRHVVLQQSHRVPARIAALAQGIIARNRRRKAKVWRSMPEQGRLDFDVSFEDLVGEVAANGATWFLLARNRHYLDTYTRALQAAGIPYRNLRGRSPLPAPPAVQAAFRLASGGEITLDELRVLAQQVPGQQWFHRGARTRLDRTTPEERRKQFLTVGQLHAWGTGPLVEMMRRPERCLSPLRLPRGVADYYLRVYRGHGAEALSRTPGVTVSTIHGVKGGEADHVVILPDMSQRTAEHYARDPEDERRVWYVGATRARQSLRVLIPSGAISFDEWV